MAEIITRAYEPGDTGAVADLMNLVAQHGGGQAYMTPMLVAEKFLDHVEDVATDTQIMVTSDGALIGVGWITPPPAGGDTIRLSGGVHPDWRGRGVGRQLLEGQLARARTLHQERAPEVQWQARLGAHLGDQSALRLFERFGMTPVRYWFDMVAQTATAPAPIDAPPQLHVSTYTPEWEQALYEAHIEVFADHWGHQRRDRDGWVERTIGMSGFRPDLSLIARDGDQIVGYILAFESADPKQLYISLVGVRRPWRRHGLAAALLGQVLRLAAADGKARATLSVDADSPTGAVGVYERVGFTIQARSVTYTLTLPARS